jgi:uncharacterized protein (TIGR03435 family)
MRRIVFDKCFSVNRKLVLSLLACLLAFHAAQGQQLSLSPVYDVASIKKLPDGGNQFQMTIMNPLRNGRFRASGVTINMLIHLAYDIPEDRIQGGPAWLSSDLYEVDARADSSVDAMLQKMSSGEARLTRQRMLQTLLADRFQLKLRRESHNSSVYSLVISKAGPKFHAAVKEENAPSASSESHFSVKVDGDTMSFRESPMRVLVELLTQQTQRQVVDETGLTGIYDFDLRFRQGSLGQIGASTDSDSPSLFTALTDQLGLKLESRKEPVPVLVVDHVEKPSPN